MRTIYEPARDLPVIHESEVVVVGGGPGGIMAAVASARTGAETLLIERYGFPGGMATAGLMTSFNGFRNERPPNHIQTVRGLAQELIDRLLAEDGASAMTAHGHFGDLHSGECPYAVGIDPEVMKRVALDMLAESGVRLLFHALFCGSLVEDRLIRAVVIESKSGRAAIEGRIFVDATGDGDVAIRAGARYEMDEKAGARRMPMSLMYRVVGIPDPSPGQRRLTVHGLTTRWGPGIGGLDGSDVFDLTTAEITARHDLASHILRLREEYPNARLVQTAETIGVRETRRIAGLDTISEEDVLSGRPRPDSIAVSSNPVPEYYGERRFLDHLGFEIPYGSVVSADLDNLLLAGRCISASQPAFQSARSMAPAMAISQASGTAAAMCILSSVRPADLDVAGLQARLERDGAVVRIPPAERPNP